MKIVFNKVHVHYSLKNLLTDWLMIRNPFSLYCVLFFLKITRLQLKVDIYRNFNYMYFFPFLILLRLKSLLKVYDIVKLTFVLNGGYQLKFQYVWVCWIVMLFRSHRIKWLKYTVNKTMFYKSSLFKFKFSLFAQTK